MRRILSARRWFSFFRQRIRDVDGWLFGVEYLQYHRILRRLVLDGGCDSLLDVGCGGSSPVAQFAGRIRHRVGMDAHVPSVGKSRAAGIHSDYLVANVLEVGSHFPPRSFDCVAVLEVIEHLSKEDGEKLLAQCERIARLKVVVSTPNGYVAQYPEPGNPLQEHLSGWTAQEFRARGYEVIGVAGWQPLRGMLMQPMWRPRAVFRRLSLLTETWAERRPDRAFQILCVKMVSQA